MPNAFWRFNFPVPTRDQFEAPASYDDVTARPSPYPGSLRRIQYNTSTVRLLSPPDAVWAAPTHPVTPPEGVLSAFKDYIQADSPTTYVVATNSVSDVERFIDPGATAIVNLHRINDIRYLNKFFEAAHGRLENGGHLVVCVETLKHWQRSVEAKYPKPIARAYMGGAFVLGRVLPKLRLTRSLWFHATKGRNRLLSRAETLGRLYCCGFEVLDIRHIDHLTFVIARKAKAPAFDMSPSYGPIFRMRRVGEGGKPIFVYKMRTMFPYAEYLQQYVYQQSALQESGKFKDDFRVTPWGRVFRRFWIDELPMLVNWVQGDLKLVGVRPLSFHYESLYPADLREQRRRFRPGLIPPFYADLPRTFENIVESERRYLASYEKNPVWTDVRYFARALWNIVFRGARSS